jgi:hypothetical protein
MSVLDGEPRLVRKQREEKAGDGKQWARATWEQTRKEGENVMRSGTETERGVCINIIEKQV